MSLEAWHSPKEYCDISNDQERQHWYQEQQNEWDLPETQTWTLAGLNWESLVQCYYAAKLSGRLEQWIWKYMCWLYFVLMWHPSDWPQAIIQIPPQHTYMDVAALIWFLANACGHTVVDVSQNGTSNQYLIQNGASNLYLMVRCKLSHKTSFSLRWWSISVPKGLLVFKGLEILYPRDFWFLKGLKKENACTNYSTLRRRLFVFKGLEKENGCTNSGAKKE